MSWMTDYLAESETAMRVFANDRAGHDAMAAMAGRISASLRAGGKLLVAGNGGSAADAQHIAGEFISRLMFDRAPLAAIALTTDSSAITATGNDYGFAHVFERQVAALGRPGDVLLGISTSGRSPNVLRAFAAARAQGLACLGFCGRDARDFTGHAEVLLCAPSTSTPIIQQIHITAAHVVCALVEREMFPRDD